jgi:LysR family hydrogen peroxide-inducible transcriptional activator
MTLTELKYIVTLANELHFGRAARQCHVSQPTLSTGVKKLEDELGVRIFERTNKSLEPTPVGRDIVAQARRVLEAADKVEALARGRQGPLSGPLRLGVIPTLGPYALPWLAPALRRDYPRLQLVVKEDLTAALVDQLRDHRIDTALVSLPIPEPWIERAIVFDEPFWFAGPKAHPLCRGKSVREEDLEQCQLILLAEGHCLRDQALAVCAKYDLAPEQMGGDFRATGLETVRQMVAAGLGCSLLPALSVNAASREPGMRVLPFRSPVPYRRVALIWRQGFSRVDDLRLLAESIRAHAPRQWVQPKGAPEAPPATKPVRP